MKDFHSRAGTAILCVVALACGLGATESRMLFQKSAVTPSDIQILQNDWRGLVPLHSTRADVERMLGSPKLSYGLVFIYRTDNERVDILYSGGPCKMSDVEPWNVPADTVLEIEVMPKATVLIRDLGEEIRKFPRRQDAHPENWVHYWNLEDGIKIDALLIDGCEEVLSVTYRPRAGDKKSAFGCEQSDENNDECLSSRALGGASVATNDLNLELGGRTPIP